MAPPYPHELFYIHKVKDSSKSMYKRQSVYEKFSQRPWVQPGGNISDDNSCFLKIGVISANFIPSSNLEFVIPKFIILSNTSIFSFKRKDNTSSGELFLLGHFFVAFCQG